MPNKQSQMAINSDGDAIDLKWISRADIRSSTTRCSVVWQNQFYFIGQVSISFVIFFVE